MKRKITLITALLIIFTLVNSCKVTGERSGSSPCYRKEGKFCELYVRKCSGCHSLYDPSSYSDEEWRRWVLKMQKYVPLTEQEIEQLSEINY